MLTRTYTFLIEKPDDSYEVSVEALSLHDAREMMFSQIQPDWLSYRHIDTIDHDDDEEEEPPEMYHCQYCGQYHPISTKEWFCPLDPNRVK